MITNDPANQPKRQYISWSQFEIAAQAVAAKLAAQRSRNQITNDLLVGITMGGLPLFTAVVNLLKDRHRYILDNLQITTTSAYRPDITALAQHFNRHIDTGNGQSHIWLFEDIVDSGATIRNLISRLTRIGYCNILPSAITACCVVNRKPDNDANPDQWKVISGYTEQYDPNKYIVFPWEYDPTPVKHVAED